MRTLAERAATAPPPSSAEGTIFYDDFSVPFSAESKAISYAIRDLATYDSPALRLPPGSASPSATINNGLDQQVTVRWQLSGNGSTWIDGDAGTVVAAATNANMAPNSIQAPYMRLRATAAVAPLSGTLNVYWHAPVSHWGIGSAEAIVSLQSRPEKLSGPWALSLKTRVRGAAANDTVTAYRWIPLLGPSRILELGALLAIDAVDSAAKQVDLVWKEVVGVNRYSSAGIRYETPQGSGTVSVLNDANVWEAVGTHFAWSSGDIVDLRVAIDVLSGRYVYASVDGEILAAARPAKSSAVANKYAPSADLNIVARTLGASSTEILIDRVWVRAIG